MVRPGGAGGWDRRVAGVPTLASINEMKNKIPSRAWRLRLLLVAAVFIAPVALSYILFFSGWRPEKINPHGTLLTPARPVTDIELKKTDGSAARFSALPRRWMLLYVGSSECTSACERALYTMRQVIAAQGKESHRAYPAMVATDTHALDMLRNRLKEYPDVTAYTASAGDITRLRAELEIKDSPATEPHYIYVVDPLGNFVMRYSVQTDPSGMRKDLQRLLRYSHIG
jgi:cytochrome oxidase Cu insertion factor (SCO1/SenC/PrrC family)